MFEDFVVIVDSFDDVIGLFFVKVEVFVDVLVFFFVEEVFDVWVGGF